MAGDVCFHATTMPAARDVIPCNKDGLGAMPLLQALRLRVGNVAGLG